MSRPLTAAAAIAVVSALTALVAPSAWASTADSPNWSGAVAVAGERFTAVSGQWRQPAVGCGADHSVAAFWVGLDGYSNQTVEQIGTRASCDGGTAGYDAWWQMWPSPYQDLPPSQYPVGPGDVVEASVIRSASHYTLTITSSRGWTFRTDQQATAQASSAEWVASSPRLCHTCRFALLADFGMVKFDDVEAADGGSPRPLSSFTASGGPVALTMTGVGGVVRSRPTAVARSSVTMAWAHQ